MADMLFRGTSVRDYINQCWRRLEKEIDLIPAEQLVRMDADQVAAEMAAKYAVECPVLKERVEDLSVDEPPVAQDTHSDVFIAVHVPFTGDREMFRCYGTTRPYMNDPITIEDGELVMRVRAQRARMDQFMNNVNGLISQINSGLASIESDLKHLVPHLTREAAVKINQRKHQLGSHASLLNALQGFSLRRRADSKESVIIPVKRKAIEVRPRAQSTPAKPDPDPELSLGDYDEILRVIRSMVTVFERSPTVFRTMEEEHLRTILLVALNGIFEGGATGETFNGEGKTDILIRVKNDNIFIAECLIWGGPEHFRKKLQDQLFRYSTWRDSKLAAIIFNRRKNFTDTVQKMLDVVTGLGNCVGAMPYNFDTGCRHRMRRDDDPQKRFVLTCLTFDVQ
jgi:hypothetical protein